MPTAIPAGHLPFRPFFGHSDGPSFGDDAVDRRAVDRPEGHLLVVGVREQQRPVAVEHGPQAVERLTDRGSGAQEDGFDRHGLSVGVGTDKPSRPSSAPLTARDPGRLRP